MSHPDEGLIHTWLDGEATPEEAARIEELVATDPEWGAAVAEARGLVAASSRIVTALDAVPRVGVATPRKRGIPTWARIAAGVVLVAGTTFVLRDSPEAKLRPDLIVTTNAPAPAAPPVASPAASPAPSASPSAPTAADQNVAPLGPAEAPKPEAPVAQAPASAVADAARGAGVAAEESSRPSVATAASAAAGGIAAPTTASAPAPAMRAMAAKRSETLMSSERRALIGCWNVSAPDSLRGILRDPTVRSARGDTLTLADIPRATRSLVVVQFADTLRGELTAIRTACPK